MEIRAAVLTCALVLAVIGTTTPDVLASGNDVVKFMDGNLKQALINNGADINGDGDLTKNELHSLNGDLDLSGSSIINLLGLEYADGVTSLDLSDNEIADISTLSDLKGLDSLDLSGNGIEDISGLSKLGDLTSLDLSDNEISDISSLYNVKTPPKNLGLKTLNVSKNYLNVADGSDDRVVTDAMIQQGCAVTFDPQKKIPVKGVSLNTENLGMCPGDTATLQAAVIPDDAALQGISWQSGDESVATINDGVVTAVSVGEASISVITDDGGKTNACTVNVVPDTLTSSTYAIDNGTVGGVDPMTGIDTFKSHFDNDAKSLFIYDSDGNEYNGPAVSTGMTVKLVVGGIERDSLSIVVTGDASGDGKMTIKDYTQVCLDLIGSKPLTHLNADAGDYTRDGKLSIGDYVQMRLATMGTDDSDGSKRVLPDLPEVSDPRIRKFLDVALAQLGKPYVWGAEGPGSFDCSGFVCYCLRQSGYDVGRWTADMYSRNKKWAYVDKDDLQPGDLMFYYSDEKDDGDHIGHIGIYLGNGYHIHASSDYGCIIICGVEGWYKTALSHGRRVFE